jgi:hypothetical protein
MSYEHQNNHSQTESSSNVDRSADSTSTDTVEGRNTRMDQRLENAIIAAKIARDTSDAVPFLGPLKASMAGLIAVLETVKVRPPIGPYSLGVTIISRKLTNVKTTGLFWKGTFRIGLLCLEAC